MNEEKLIEYLSGIISPERNRLFKEVIQNRTRYITVALEDIYQPQNASAVLRTCDCFGIQDVHIIENSNTFNINTNVVQGASKWLTIYKYNRKRNNSFEAIQYLKKNGYRIIATTPGSTDSQLESFDLTKGKAALVFGSEKPGISEVIKSHADEFLKIPMFGFTESFNISVSAAIILYDLTLTLRNSGRIKWRLTDTEAKELKLEWLRATIKKSRLLEKEYLKTLKE